MQANNAESPIVHDLFEKKTGSWQYIVADPSTLKAAIIDPVLDYDSASATISTQTADSILDLVKEKGYEIDMIVETHAHADHMTAASYLQMKLAQQQGHRPIIGIGGRIGQVQEMFGKKYNIGSEQFVGVFDKLFEDDEVFNIGSLNAKAIHLPGHTPDHMGYKIGDNIFVGDSVFNADLGTARADFPGGSASTLFASGRKVLSLPEHVKVYIGHDYPPEGRSGPLSCLTVAEHRKNNKHLQDSMKEKDFIELRNKRDATLPEPKLIHQSMQMNLRAGRLPETTTDGHRLLATPIKLATVEW